MRRYRIENRYDHRAEHPVNSDSRHKLLGVMNTLLGVTNTLLGVTNTLLGVTNTLLAVTDTLLAVTDTLLAVTDTLLAVTKTGPDAMVERLVRLPGSCNVRDASG